MLYDDYRERLNGRPAIKAVAATWTRPKQPNGTTAALTRCTVPAYRKFESISLQPKGRRSLWSPAHQGKFVGSDRATITLSWSLTFDRNC